MTAFYKAPTSNFWSTTLNGAISDSDTTVTLNSTTGLQAPGFLVIDREDGSGTATPDARELIFYTGISGSDLTGVTRAADNSTARSHADGALVEATFTVGMWNDLRTAVATAMNTSGALLPQSAASIATLTSTTATATDFAGVRGQFIWTKSSLATVQASVASDTHFELLRASQNLTIDGVYLSLISAPSTAPLEVDVAWSAGPTGTFASIFSTRPFIDIGEYSTSSSATPGTVSHTSLASGTFLRAEILGYGDAHGLTISVPATSRK